MEAGGTHGREIQEASGKHLKPDMGIDDESYSLSPNAVSLEPEDDFKT